MASEPRLHTYMYRFLAMYVQTIFPTPPVPSNGLNARDSAKGFLVFPCSSFTALGLVATMG